MHEIELNIGLVEGRTKDPVEVGEVCYFLRWLLEPTEAGAYVTQSATEPTLVWRGVCRERMTEIATLLLCERFNQEAVAGICDGQGFLWGPNAAAWGGAFDPQYFIRYQQGV